MICEGTVVVKTLLFDSLLFAFLFSYSLFLVECFFIYRNGHSNVQTSVHINSSSLEQIQMES